LITERPDRFRFADLVLRKESRVGWPKQIGSGNRVCALRILLNVFLSVALMVPAVTAAGAGDDEDQPKGQFDDYEVRVIPPALSPPRRGVPSLADSSASSCTRHSFTRI
jgi:hypothetical protein